MYASGGAHELSGHRNLCVDTSACREKTHTAHTDAARRTQAQGMITQFWRAHRAYARTGICAH
eukprot:4283286-Alexandrium_andersonii.AAC.1